MNINIYLEDDLGKEITKQAKVLHKSRNSVVRAALQKWLAERVVTQWPECVLQFTGDTDFPTFENYRSELTGLQEDPLE